MVTDVPTGNLLASVADNMSAVATGIPASLWKYESLPDGMGVIGKIYIV